MDNYSKAIELLESNVTIENLLLTFKKDFLKYKEMLNGTVVLCGLSSFTRQIIKHNLLDPQRVRIVDLEYKESIYCGFQVCDIKDLPSFSENALYIVCSNPYAGYFINILRKQQKKNIVLYHAFCINHQDYDFALDRYSSKYILDIIHHYVENKQFYKEFLKNLQNDYSRTIMTQMILYFFTLNAQYADFISANKTYFYEKLLPLSKCTRFVDCGGFDGDTLIDFLEHINDYKVYWYFEPDPKLYRKAQTISDDSRIRYCNAGVSNYNGTATFKSVELSKVGKIVATPNKGENHSDLTVNVIKLDDFIDSSVSAIKMDIEGEEYNAILGCKEIIARELPYLIISVEHKPDDIKALSTLIHSIDKRYSFSLHTLCDSLFTDMILYCTPSQGD